ncbi:MAG: hypothetical protein HQL36_08645 [Alphaproteobacteria bacterium]|nr:hypothetical protein [Alphaproteobacteria bacterium]
MAFGGVKSDQQRADLLVFLNGQADSPIALPQPTTAELAAAKSAPAAAPAKTEPDAAEIFATVAGMNPAERPSWAPKVSQIKWEDGRLKKAMRGIPEQVAANLTFFGKQGNWYTPFERPGMTGLYDIRNLHPQ